MICGARRLMVCQDITLNLTNCLSVIIVFFPSHDFRLFLWLKFLFILCELDNLQKVELIESDHYLKITKKKPVKVSV